MRIKKICNWQTNKVAWNKQHNSVPANALDRGVGGGGGGNRGVRCNIVALACIGKAELLNKSWKEACICFAAKFKCL